MELVCLIALNGIGRGGAGQNGNSNGGSRDGNDGGLREVDGDDLVDVNGLSGGTSGLSGRRAGVWRRFEESLIK